MQSVVLICIVAVAFGQQQQLDCVQQKETLMKCKKDILVSQESKNVQDQQRKIIEKCAGQDTISKCLSKSDECLVKAEETAESSAQKKQALKNAAKCWAGNSNRGGQQPGPGQMPLVNQRGGPQGAGPGPNGQGPMMNSGPPMQIHPEECLIPAGEQKVAECLDAEEKNIDESVTRKLNQEMEDCIKNVAPDCIPRNPNVDMCMQQAYAPVLNITMSSYKQCMTEAGYKFPTQPQMPNFQGGPNQPQRPNFQGGPNQPQMPNFQGGPNQPQRPDFQGGPPEQMNGPNFW